jgi:tyrosyl-tRNA synthetase
MFSGRALKAVVGRYYGRSAALKAKEEFENIFRKKGLPEEIPVYTLGDNSDVWLPQMMKDSGLAKSTGEAMRLIRQGGVSVDGEKWPDPDKKLPAGKYLLKVGKRRFLQILPKSE